MSWPTPPTAAFPPGLNLAEQDQLFHIVIADSEDAKKIRDTGLSSGPEDSQKTKLKFIKSLK